MVEKKTAKKKLRIYKKGRDCPRCGAGTKLAEHKERFSCGRCGYYERKTKSEQ